MIQLTNSLENFYKKLQDANFEKEVLRKEVEQVRPISIELENKLSTAHEELKKVRTLNEKWQEIAMEKCNLMHGTYSILYIKINML